MRKDNIALYIIILIVSIVICAISLFFNTSSQIFTILASIGCSGIVSIVVSFLLEVSNRKREAYKDKKTIDAFLENFDICIEDIMHKALNSFAKQYRTFDVDGNYTISDICLLLEKLNDDNKFFIYYVDDLNSCVEGLNFDVLLNFPNAKGHELYSTFNGVKMNLSAIKNYANRVGNDALNAILSEAIFSMIDEIYKIRENNISFSISKNDRDYIMKFREAKFNNKTNI